MVSDQLSKPTTKCGQLQRAYLAVLLEHERDGALPTSNRFVFYELEQRGIVRKPQPGETRRTHGLPGGEQDVIDAGLQLRERGIVPWSWIVDETRDLFEWSYGVSVVDHLAAEIDHARIDLWAEEPPPLILCESRTFGGVLNRTLGPEYLCPAAATNGQVQGFLVTDVAPCLVGNERVVLYVGDLDLSGGQIEQNTRRVLEREAGREVDWRRVALTEEQMARYELEPILKGDNRYRDGKRHLAVEVESLGQSTVTEITRETLDDLLPEPLAVVRERERRQREQARGLIGRWR
jgi:hypothetical protein